MTDTTQANLDFRVEDHGFSTDPAELPEKEAASERTMDRLVRQPGNILRRLHKVTSLTVTFGAPTAKNLPPHAREAAEAFGFKPVTRTLSGTIPMLFHYVPFWVDPTGYALLSVYGTHRWYLHTYFEDGSAISTSVRKSGNQNTEAYVTFDFGEGYPMHMKAVKTKMDATGLRPIVRNTPRLVRKGWGVYHMFHVPPLGALFFVISGIFISAMSVWFVWTFLGAFGVVDENTLPAALDWLNGLANLE